ncbi:unnamed protein product [Cuscuta europaea]|uniref:Fatty acyl-CoA reductase n=1 Tax=Cuscuta europaea TaxID=41803 RepID=A0A9P0YFC0_CUSEU|nr:unnamed protein product [Cuscuta europaea]
MQLHSHNATEKEVKSAMKDLGIQRAKLHGWPNTYSFTKAMGEMLVLAFADNLCAIILRPTIITSTYKEPFPGWIEGARTMDIFVLMYGKGKSNFMIGDPDSILDVIPVDMVVNSMLAAVVHHDHNRRERSSPSSFIYHIGSSDSNVCRPLKLCDVISMMYRYFTNNPWTSMRGEVVKVREYVLLPSITSLRRYITIHYLPLLQVLKLMNMLLYHYFDDKCAAVEKNISMVIRFAEIYRPSLLILVLHRLNTMDTLYR